MDRSLRVGLQCLATALILSISPFAGTQSARADDAPRPNIVFILADDMGWNQPGFQGGNPELTPHLDGLAAQSVRLTQFYSHSVCAPTRGALLTGRYAFRNWMDWRSEDFGKPSYLKKLGLTLAHNDRGEPTRRIHALDTNERTVAEALQEAGYFTGIVGKWHCGEWLDEHLPMAQGFNHQYGHYAWGVDYYTKTIEHNAPARFAVYDWHRNQQPIQEEGYTTDLIAAEAQRVIASQSADKPFFLYVPFNAVHGPLNDPPRYTDKFDVRQAMLKCLDDAVGKIVAAVDQSDFAQNTLVVFANDNGPVLEEMSKPYRGTKNTTFEGGVRVPCLVRWPGHVDAGSSNDGMMFIADWYTTCIALAGGSREQPLPVDGLDMTGMLFGGEPSPRDEIIFEVTGSVRLPTIRSGDWKLMGDVLYNIKTDPYETTDVADQHPQVVRRLADRLAEVGRQRPPLGDKPLLMDPPLPYIYGQKESLAPPAWLKQAVDAVRAKQPQHWAPGETPWPQAPVGANAAKQ
ncbi:Arylsulfatase [Rosistilla carotiformis]|uniref:Arylsulfatase n=1 Tax=Rosistilla carotiformis TaxID=2528017 RepID=A0A518JX03_9BACT|nr:arylsulfatase [Rosistilla carotiformis]QDV70087.1 Arylsulfatase [Rosistilla carotiformis]